MPIAITKTQSNWYCYLLPLLITGLLVLCCWYNSILLFIPFLVVLNLFNQLLGEFNPYELPALLYHYTHCPKINFVKLFSALVFITLNIWLIYFINQEHFSYLAFIALVFSVAIVNCTFTMALAHELLHEERGIPRTIANLLLFFVCLPYFANDHLQGHHKYVATPLDASSASKGCNFYSYLFKVIGYRIKQSFGLNKMYPQEKAKAIMYQNYKLTLLNISFLALIFYCVSSSKMVLLYFFTQALLSYLMFELSNYVQHYGLQRKMVHNSAYELIGINHAWNYYYKYTNYLTYLIPVHSHHHADSLLHDKGKFGPKLPHSYFKMMLMALIPFWWFNKMNPLCDKY